MSKRTPCERWGCVRDGTFGRCLRRGCPLNSDEAEQAGYEEAAYYAKLEAEQCRCEGDDASQCGWHREEADA